MQFIHLFSKYLWMTLYGPGTVSGFADTMKIRRVSGLSGWVVAVSEALAWALFRNRLGWNTALLRGSLYPVTNRCGVERPDFIAPSAEHSAGSPPLLSFLWGSAEGRWAWITREKKERAAPDMQALAGHSQLGHLIFLLGIYDFTEYHLKQDYAETMTK